MHKGRPKKQRRAHGDPRIILFSPRGRPGRPDEVELAMEEFEAIRLADCLGQDQKKAAQAMHISQQTFSRILKKAHKIIADALVYGKILKIQGGHYIIQSRKPQDHLKNPQIKHEQKEFGFL